MEVLALIPNQYGYAPGQRGSIELWDKVLAPAGINIHYAPFETPRLHEVRGAVCQLFTSLMIRCLFRTRAPAMVTCLI